MDEQQSGRSGQQQFCKRQVFVQIQMFWHRIANQDIFFVMPATLNFHNLCPQVHKLDWETRIFTITYMCNIVVAHHPSLRCHRMRTLVLFSLVALPCLTLAWVSLLSLSNYLSYVLKFWPSKWYYNQFHRNLFKKDTDLQIFVTELSPMGMCRIKICLPLSTASFPLFSLALHGISGSPRYSKKKLKIEKAVYTYMYLHALEMSRNLPGTIKFVMETGIFWEYLRTRP